ncbi:MAG: hypothetical protein ABI227_11440 [Rhodanobacter sp.]
MSVSDIILQHVDSLLIERIKALARDRQCSINDVLLQAVRNGLGMSGAQQLSETLRDQQTALNGHWEDSEQGVFQEALRALAQTHPTQLAPESIRFDGSAAGAE